MTTLTSLVIPANTVRMELTSVAGSDYRMPPPLLDDYRVPVNRLTHCMTYATFCGLVDAHPKLEDLSLQGLGEPLLAPGLGDMILYASRRGVRVSLDTNASLLYRDRVEDLVESGLSRLRVITDGSDANNYEDIRHVMDNFGPILENLSALSAVRRLRRSELRTEVVYLVTEHNLKLLPDMVALLGGIWVPEIRVLSTLDGRRTWRVFDEALKVAEEYCVVLDLAAPGPPNTTPYYGTDSCIRTYN